MNECVSPLISKAINTNGHSPVGAQRGQDLSQAFRAPTLNTAQAAQACELCVGGNRPGVRAHPLRCVQLETRALPLSTDFERAHTTRLLCPAAPGESVLTRVCPSRVCKDGSDGVQAVHVDGLTKSCRLGSRSPVSGQLPVSMAGDVCGATLVSSSGFPRLAGHLGPPAPASCAPERLAPGMPPPGPVLMHAGGSTETATRRGAEARRSGGAAREEGLHFGAYALWGALGHPCKRRHLTGWGGKWWATVSLR